MASTVDSATLKVQIQEDITLNGVKRGDNVVLRAADVITSE